MVRADNEHAVTEEGGVVWVGLASFGEQTFTKGQHEIGDQRGLDRIFTGCDDAPKDHQHQWVVRIEASRDKRIKPLGLPDRDPLVGGLIVNAGVVRIEQPRRRVGQRAVHAKVLKQLTHQPIVTHRHRLHSLKHRAVQHRLPFFRLRVAANHDWGELEVIPRQHQAPV